MPNNNPVFVFDGKLCKFEGMTKEQIINAIAEATGVTPSDVDAGFISTLVEQNKSNSIHFWFGTQAEYDALESYDSNTFYIIDGDATIDDLQAAVQNCDAEIDEIREDIQALDTDMTEAKGDIEGLESDMTEAKGDIQALENIFAFDSAQAGFEVLTDWNPSSSSTYNTLPSRGLYILYIYENGYADYTPIIVYYDGYYEMRTTLFKYQYHESGTLKSVIAQVKIYTNGQANLNFIDPTTANCKYTIKYRKIG